MGQKVRPTGFRTGIFLPWQSTWFAGKKDFAELLFEDQKIRKFIHGRYKGSGISKVRIERTREKVVVVILTSKVGVIIGKKGQGIEQMRHDLGKALKKTVEISVQEIKNPETNARLVAASIAEQLEKRVSFKRLMKKAGQAAMKSGAKGIKICISGRIGGAEIARIEWLRLGSVPLHTLRANIDYAHAEALTTYGLIGVKVWICKGEYPTGITTVRG